MAEGDAADDLTSSGDAGDSHEPPPFDLGPDTLVDELQRGAGEPHNLITLWGFVGESDAPGCHRLFTDPTLKRWVDIRDDDICHRRRIAGEQDAYGGRSMVWVKSGALLVKGEVTVASAEADFLTGPWSSESRMLPGDGDIECATKAPKPDPLLASPAASPNPGCCRY